MKDKRIKSRRCNTCKEIKPIESFYGKNSEYEEHYWCKSCFNAYQYKRIFERKQMFVRFLGDRCEHCGIKHNNKNTVIFDFHHKTPSTKDADWTKMRKWSLERIRTEIIKCIVLCSNCHRLVHNIGHTKK